jgi:hypothetical protein
MAGRWQRCLELAVLTTVLAGAGPAHAHHSFAMYDNDKVVTVDGTVKEFVWGNPHVILRLLGTATDGGGEQLWTLEFPAPAQISRNGWTHSTLKAGDKVKVELHPFKSGRPGGAFMTAMLPNGEKIGR